MQPENLLRGTGIASLLLLCSWCIVSNTLPGKGVKAINIEEDIRIYKMIKTKEIKAALAKSKDKKIALNIYPVKLSADFNKKDYDIMTIFRDANQGNKNLGTKVRNSTFEAQAKWYVSFLKSKEMHKNDIPYGYFIEIDSSMIKGMIGISICIIPQKSTLEYCWLPGAAKSTNKQSTKNNFDVKCPPFCCLQFQAQIIKIDSVGKCPPDCRRSNLLYESTLKKIIDSEFKLTQ